MLVIVAVVHNVASAALSTSIFSRKTSRVVFKLSTLLGTPAHELSHLIFCWVFGHKVTSIKLLDLSFRSSTLGYVNHQWNTRSWYQSIGCFFIAIAPLFTACAVVYIAYVRDQHALAMSYPYNATVPQALWFTIRQAIDLVTDWILASTLNLSSFGKLLLVSIICFHCIPSRTDFHNAAKGSIIIVVIVGLGVLLNLTAKHFGIDILPSPHHFNGLIQVLTFTACAVLFAQLFWLVLFLLAKIAP